MGSIIHLDVLPGLLTRERAVQVCKRPSFCAPLLMY